MNRLRQLLATLLLSVLFILGSIGLLWAQESGGNWAEPVNLSQSGATVNPVMAMDSDGDLHVLWQDNYLEMYVYQYSDGAGWSTPVTATLPFTTSVPRLFIDGNDRMHAFWRFANGSDDPSVSYSSVPITGVANFRSWSPVRTLAADAADFDVELDAQGQLHLLFARPEETADAPAGIYHSHTMVDGLGVQRWLTPTVLYASTYFRGLDSSNANVELTTAVSGNDSWLFAVWDNRPRKQLFFARSGNGGSSWEEPVEIVGPESGSSVIFPFNVKIGVKDDNVVLVWNNGQPGVSCQQYAMSSPDLGISWGERRLMDDLLPGTANCVSRNEFITGAALLFLVSTVQNQQFMWAWNGNRWSPPVIQSILTSFDNPETLNAVVLRCQQKMDAPDDQLLVIGCEEDIRTYGDGDIWLLSRPLGSAAAWFPPPTTWGPVDLVNSEATAYHSLVLTPGADGEFLAFWTLVNGLGNGQPTIVNARLSGGAWQLPETVLTIPRTQIASPLAAVTSGSVQLFLTWADNTGQLYLAQTAVSDAHIASLWSPVAEIPLEREATFPTMGIDNNNTLYLAYTIPVNEARGVYLQTSTDGGRTWNDPVTVFDGTEAGWEVVGPAEIAVTGTGRMHFLWEQQSLLSGGRPQTQALYYSYSEDGGQTFLPASMAAEGFITWRKLLATDEQEIHQFWRTAEDHAVAVQHAYSLDGGQRWSQPEIINTSSGPVAVAGSEGGGVSLLQLMDTAVNEWHWQNGRWTQPAGIPFTDIVATSLSHQAIAASLASSGALLTLFTGQIADSENEDDLLNGLFASSRAVSEETAVQPPVLPTPAEPVSTTAPSADNIVTPVPTTEVAATQTATATAVPDLNNTEETPSGNSMVDLLLGVVPAGLLVLVVFGIGIWGVRRRSR